MLIVRRQRKHLGMASGSQSAAARVPRWVIVVAFLVSVCAFGALLLLDEPGAPASPSLTGWVSSFSSQYLATFCLTYSRKPHLKDWLRATGGLAFF
jgi:hypothetical protein